MRQDFTTEELKGELERGLGFRLRSLTRLDGASALNFKAVRETDGLAFAVKCIPPRRRDMYEHLVRHLDETKGTKAVSRIFAETCPATFRSYHLVCLTWCEGRRMFPDQLTESQFVAFVDEYQRFSEVMQKSTLIVQADPIDKWRTAFMEQCCGFWGRFLRRFADRELPKDETAYCADRLRVIHGDFHHGNFLFANGRLSGFFDLEEFCYGYPADDIVRYFVCAAEHLKWYELGRLRLILKRFERAVCRLPYPTDEWLTAIDGLLVRKIYKKTQDRAPGLLMTANLLFRARFYRRLKEIVRRNCLPQLRRSLSDRLACEIVDLTPMHGVCSAKTYHATAADGRDLFVKVADTGKSEWNDGMKASELVARHAGHPLLPHPLFPRPVVFGAGWLSVFEFRKFRHVRLEDMTDGQFDSFASGCREVFELIAGDVDLSGRRDYATCARAAAELARRCGVARRLLGSVIALGPADYDYPAGTRTQLIHDDFSSQNYAFGPDGRLAGILDFDLLDTGSPVEPLASTIVQSIRKQGVWRNDQKRKQLIRRMRQLKVCFGRSSEEWRIAINRVRLRDAEFTLEKRPKGGWRAAFSFWRRDRRLRWLLDQVRTDA